jgi:23S rRNA (uracil1939-C5)-methyltransferase
LKKGIILRSLQIIDIAYGGSGIAKITTKEGEFVIFVENSIPGQVVDARVVKIKKRYAEAKLVGIISASPHEQKIPFQSIPGAVFATWPIEQQTDFKKKSTLEMYKRIGEENEIESKFDQFIPSPRIWFYRNKMEYSFSTIVSELQTGKESGGFALGFKRRGQWWAVEKLERASGLFDEVLENNLHKISDFCLSSGLSAWDPSIAWGFFRFLVVRRSFIDDELLFNLVTTSDGIEKFDSKGFVECLESILGKRLAGVYLTINDEKGDTSKQPAEASTLIYGKAKVVEKILGLKFEISMQSFFQTNPASAEKLYAKTIEYIVEALENSEQAEQDVALDLFCGTGTIAQLMSTHPKLKKIIGVDMVEEAIEDARSNALINNIKNINFHTADVGKFLQNFPQYKNKIAVTVLDPPRGGIAPKTLLKIIELNSNAIVYVSCNPSTQARDGITLKQAGYTMVKFSLVDQFPHTAHIESIALFIKRK